MIFITLCTCSWSDVKTAPGLCPLFCCWPKITAISQQWKKLITFKINIRLCKNVVPLSISHNSANSLPTCYSSSFSSLSPMSLLHSSPPQKFLIIFNESHPFYFPWFLTPTYSFHWNFTFLLKVIFIQIAYVYIQIFLPYMCVHICIYIYIYMYIHTSLCIILIKR